VDILLPSFHDVNLLFLIFRRKKMSSYQNVVGGKLKLKGKALDVKSGGVKRKRKQKHNRSEEDEPIGNDHPVEGLWLVSFSCPVSVFSLLSTSTNLTES
jgi:FAM32A